MDLRTRYVIKGINKEQTIHSKVNIFYDDATGKITKVEDKWDGKLPESSIQNVSVEQVFSPWWWVHYGESWAFWGWSFTWDMWWWQVCFCCYSSGGKIGRMICLWSVCWLTRFVWYRRSARLML